jgi:hypothetical protein
MPFKSSPQVVFAKWNSLITSHLASTSVNPKKQSPEFLIWCMKLTLIGFILSPTIFVYLFVGLVFQFCFVWGLFLLCFFFLVLFVSDGNRG